MGADNHVMQYPVAPPEKLPSEYSYQERRAELARMDETDNLDSVLALADRYNVTEAVIRRDIEVIRGAN